MEGKGLFNCVQVHSIRGMVDTLNNMGIRKDDIVFIHEDEGTFFIVYVTK